MNLYIYSMQKYKNPIFLHCNGTLYVIQLSDSVYNVTLQLDVVFKKKKVKYVIYLLSDRVYNVTFPAYDVYSLRLRLREYRS
jgi:hypothetical protein